MSANPTELIDNEHVARQACIYSRAHILEGSTQIANNMYDIYKQKALLRAVSDLRIAAAEKDRSLLFEIDDTIQRFKQNIAYCKKYSLGNCGEMAQMALDYVINHEPNVNAEVYQIAGGDHALLVVGRLPSSHPNQPETWGSQAYICDPWSDAVYPAADYLTRTKNFYCTVTSSTDGIPVITNHTEDFDKTRHTFTPLEKMNTTYIKKGSEEAVKNIVNIYSSIHRRILSALDDLVVGLNKISARLVSQYGKDDSKLQVINDKIKKISILAKELSEYFKAPMSTNHGNCYRFGVEAQNRIKEVMSAYKRTSFATPDEKSQLSKYRDEHSVGTWILKFFNIKPKTAREFKAAISNSDQKLSDLSDLVSHTMKK